MVPYVYFILPHPTINFGTPIIYNTTLNNTTHYIMHNNKSIYYSHAKPHFAISYTIIQYTTLPCNTIQYHKVYLIHYATIATQHIAIQVTALPIQHHALQLHPIHHNNNHRLYYTICQCKHVPCSTIQQQHLHYH